MAVEKSPSSDTRAQLPSAFALFGPSWEAVKLNISTFILLFLIFIAGVGVAIGIGWGLITVFKDVPVALVLLMGLLTVVGIIFLAVVGAATIYVQIKSAQRQAVTTKAALKQGYMFRWRFLGLTMLAGLGIFLGLLLLIIPGVFLFQRLLLSPYFLIDRNLPVVEAMNASASTGKQYSGAIWGIVGVNVLINIVSNIPLVGWVIGFILDIAYYCAPAVRYEQIKNAS